MSKQRAVIPVMLTERQAWLIVEQMVSTEQRWTSIASKMLVGRKIVQVRYMDDKESEALGWGERCLVIQLDDGNIIYPAQDDEGNGAGALFTNDKKNPTLPVIR